MAFKPVSSQIDFPGLERQILEYWHKNGILEKYLQKNQKAKKRFSFLDGPITANNPMGVHHAWGRTYKDLWQRFFTMRGFSQRYQNGFDCQGLWVEVEVEKELGFKSKKDIEAYGVANFVNKCKERVVKYAGIQTEQSRRLGYFMDWDHSYFTMSDNNNYAIWGFLKECWQRGWIYRGHDVVPWCPRCETAISQHEILTEDYRQLTHDSVFLGFPICGRENEYLLVWTTTPWTLIANTAVAVDGKLEYSLVQVDKLHRYWVASELVKTVFGSIDYQIVGKSKGLDLVGLKYSTPFDSIPLVTESLHKHPDRFHIVVATDDLIMPISREEGTGLVHTSTSTGQEDHQLGKKLGLPVIPAIDDSANYLEGFGEFTGLNAKQNPRIVIDYLLDREKNGSKWIYRITPYSHRYPVCWRCKSELVWKVADEWYIAMDRPDPTDTRRRTFRQQMKAIVGKIHWLPAFGMDRELDWLENMHDWLISKKNRYWGLALPIYECRDCDSFVVIGSRQELEERAASGWKEFSGHSPHRPWIDGVKITCPGCGGTVSRILDVGNPWLDAGIVSVSTLPGDWFPADFITESFPGQFKNWFYSLIAMGTVLKKEPPFKTVLGFASLLDEKGEVMHKSSGNMIEFNEGADRIGVDVMRWIFVTHNPENNLLFGYHRADEVRRQFLLILWNIYNFFVTYARIDNFSGNQIPSPKSSNVLDKWIMARLNQVVNTVTESLGRYDALTAGRSMEEFIVGDLSGWYVRRSRDRIGPSVSDSPDKQACYRTLYKCLTIISRVLAPFTPFVSEEIYRNLTDLDSVHLSDWPKAQKLSRTDLELIDSMNITRKIVELGLSSRKTAGIKVRQPLPSATVFCSVSNLTGAFQQLILEELNLKKLYWQSGKDLAVSLDLNLDDQLLAEGELRELIRQVQQARKNTGVRIDQKIVLTAPLPKNEAHRQELQHRTLAEELVEGDKIHIKPL